MGLAEAQRVQAGHQQRPGPEVGAEEGRGLRAHEEPGGGLQLLRAERGEGVQERVAVQVVAELPARHRGEHQLTAAAGGGLLAPGTLARRPRPPPAVLGSVGAEGAMAGVGAHQGQQSQHLHQPHVTVSPSQPGHTLHNLPEQLPRQTEETEAQAKEESQSQDIFTVHTRIRIRHPGHGCDWCSGARYGGWELHGAARRR